MVDDEAEFVNPICRHLKREGFLMDSAFSVEEARRKIDDSTRIRIPYDLLITEVVRPNLEAIEILQWIKKNHPEVSVILVSEFGDADMPGEIMREDLDRYAKKPLTPQKMIGLINSLSQNRVKS